MPFFVSYTISTFVLSIHSLTNDLNRLKLNVKLYILFLPYSDGAYRIPRPIYFSVQFKHMVLGLHIILAAEEDRTSDLASLFLVDLPMGLPRLESFR